MKDTNSSKQGDIREDNEMVIYQIEKEYTNLIDADQLDELKKTDPLFFRFLKGQESKQHVHIYYEKALGYHSIIDFAEADQEMKRKIAIGLLSIEKLIGTQYTTFLHPTNIYVDAKGNVKLVHRGIRSVFPTEELTVPQLLSDLKKIIILLFSSTRFSEVSDWKNLKKGNPFLEKIYRASSIHDLRQILQAEETPAAAKEVQLPNKQLLSGVLIGLIAGVLLIYLFQVMPMTQAADVQMDRKTSLEDENNQLKEVNAELEEELEHSDIMNEAFEHVIHGDTEEAINLLESAAYLEDHAEAILFEQYLLLNTQESLKKAVNMGMDDPISLVEELRSLKTKEAKAAILSIESSLPEVIIEQAWINGAYDKVIDTYTSLKDNDRAKYLAAYSYIEQGNYKKAMQLGEELENKNIQIESLKLQIKEIKKDKDLDESEIEEQVEELEEMIEELE